MNACRAGHQILRMSIMNWGEVYYLTSKAANRTYAQRLPGRLRTVYKVETISIPDDAVMAAARLKAAYPISYADAFAAQAAISTDSPLITGDPELYRTHDEIGLELEWLGDFRASLAAKIKTNRLTV